MISFTVHGIPVAQGSMVAFMPKNARRPIMHSSNSNELKKWRSEVAKMASLTLSGGSPAGRSVPMRVTVLFVFLTPQSSKYIECVKPPDLDKLVRAILDSLTGVVWDDDAQVTELHATKEYGAEPRCEVYVEEVSVQQEMLRLVPPNQEEVPF